MPVKPPFNIYREQFWPPHHGFPLWNPNPVEGVYSQVSIGDVGYISGGAFIRMFNVTLSWDHESNKALGEPCCYDLLRLDDIAIRRETFGKVDYYSRRVSREENAGNTQASSPDQAEGVTYTCRGRGVLLSLPHGGLRQEVIQTKLFRKYMGDNVDNWFKWAKDKGLPVKHMEDLVFVYGCTLVTSWAAAVFDDYAADARVSLASRMLENGGSSFVWSSIRGTVEYHDSQLDPKIPYAPQNRCAFIKCLRAKRTLFWVQACAQGELLEGIPTSSDYEDSHRKDGFDILEEDVVSNFRASFTDIPQEDVIVDIRRSVTDIPQEDVIDNIWRSFVDTPQEGVIDNDRESAINSCQESAV